MPVFDLGNSVAVAPLHNPGDYTADATGNAVDTANFAYAFIILHAGNIAAGQQVLFTIEHAETASGTFSACKLIGTDTDAQVRLQNAQDNTCFIVRIDLNNTKRFIRAHADHSADGGHSYSAEIVLLPYQTDATQSDSGAASQPTISI